MKKYVSVSQYPGNTGRHFYSKFFEFYGISADYEPLGCTDLSIIDKLKQQGVSGISVSMPFKREIFQHLDEIDISAAEYGTCNTVVNDQGIYRGYNSDLAGVEHVCGYIQPGQTVCILGSGAMSKMFEQYLRQHGIEPVVAARSLDNWSLRFGTYDVIINCTALGTSTADSPFLPGQLAPSTKLIIDLAIKHNDLAKQAVMLDIKYVSGREFYQYQFFRQFEVYTGITPDREQYLIFERELYEKI